MAARDRAAVSFEQSLIAAAEDLGEDVGDHAGRGRLRHAPQENGVDGAVPKKIKILAWPPQRRPAVAGVSDGLAQRASRRTGSAPDFAERL